MSYQHISQTQILGEEHCSPRVEVLAVSDDMPENLQSLLQEFCKTLSVKVPRVAQTHFYYHIMVQHHVLSAMSYQDASGVRIHHLVLTEEEVIALQKNSSRPTPAGIIETLYSVDFWQTSSSSPTSSPQEPKVSASQLPDASTQECWKLYTGHKRNATALLAPPYLGKCLMSISPELTNAKALRLLHESTWLSASRGWGKCFSSFFSGSVTDFDAVDIAVTCTNSAEEDSFRLAAHPIPILVINNNLSILEEDSGTRSSFVRSGALLVMPQAEQRQTPMAAPSFTPEPYKYTEAQDYETFDVKPPIGSHARWLRYIGGLLGLTVLVYVVVSNYVDFASAPVSDEVLTTQEEQRAVHEFAAIVRQSQPAEPQLQRLKASLLPSMHPRHAILAECIDLLLASAHKAEGHPDNLLYLLTHATMLDLKPEELCHYYLITATRDYPAEEWVQLNSDTTVLHGWKNLFKKYPQLKQAVSNDRRLQHHMRPIIRQLAH